MYGFLVFVTIIEPLRGSGNNLSIYKHLIEANILL